MINAQLDHCQDKLLCQPKTPRLHSTGRTCWCLSSSRVITATGIWHTRWTETHPFSLFQRAMHSSWIPGPKKQLSIPVPGPL